MKSLQISVDVRGNFEENEMKIQGRV